MLALRPRTENGVNVSQEIQRGRQAQISGAKGLGGLERFPIERQALSYLPAFT